MPPPLFPTIYGNFHTFPMPMAHPAESRRKPRRDWNVSRSISFCSSLFSSILPEFLRKYIFVQNQDFRQHRSAVLSGMPTARFPYGDGILFQNSFHWKIRFLLQSLPHSFRYSRAASSLCEFSLPEDTAWEKRLFPPGSIS